MSILSEYRLLCGEFSTVDKWLHFAEVGMLYRKAFLEKWIVQNEYIESERYHVLTFEDMVEDPKAQLRRIIEFVTPKHAIDTDAIESAFESCPVSAKWSLDGFVFAETVPRLETIISGVWEQTMRMTQKLAGRWQ